MIKFILILIFTIFISFYKIDIDIEIINKNNNQY